MKTPRKPTLTPDTGKDVDVLVRVQSFLTGKDIDTRRDWWLAFTWYRDGLYQVLGRIPFIQRFLVSQNLADRRLFRKPGREI